MACYTYNSGMFHIVVVVEVIRVRNRVVDCGKVNIFSVQHGLILVCITAMIFLIWTITTSSLITYIFAGITLMNIAINHSNKQQHIRSLILLV